MLSLIGVLDMVFTWLDRRWILWRGLAILLLAVFAVGCRQILGIDDLGGNASTFPGDASADAGKKADADASEAAGVDSRAPVRDASIGADADACSGTDCGDAGSMSIGDGGGDAMSTSGTPMEVPPASLSIDPATKDFSTVVTGMFVEAGFQVSNTGGMSTTAPDVQIDGADPTMFSVPSNGCMAAILPGASCVITVRFTPTSAGALSARLNVSASMGGAVSASLQGVGIAPGALTMSPGNESFDSVLQGTSGAAVTFTVTNTGGSATGPLTTSTSGSSDFAISVDTCAGKSLGTTGTCTLSVIFAPAAAGQKSGTLVVSATPGGTASSGLTGVGLAPATLGMAPLAATYAATVVGVTSATQTFTITNHGGTTAGTTTALVVSLAGANEGDFTIASTTCTSTLAAEATCATVVAFDPTTTGDRVATLAVSATPGSSTSAALDGTGLAAATIDVASASGSSTSFGTVVTGTTAVETFTVSNPGQQATTALTVSVTGAGFTQAPPAAGDCVSGSTVLAAKTSCTVHVSAAPTAAGALSGALSVTAATGGAAMLTLTGTAVSPGALSVSPSSESFPSVLSQSTGNAVSFTVTNTGGAATGSLSASITGSTEFTIVAGADGCTGKTLGAAGQCTIGVVFAPASAGQKTGTLLVTGSPGGTASSSLSGTGQAQASLSATPTTVTFADTVDGATSAGQIVTVTNGGDAVAGMSTSLAVGTPSTNEFTVSGSTCGMTLAGKTSCAITVVFKPVTAAANKSATLVISATPGGSQTVTLHGNGLSPAALTLAAATGSSADFGQEVVGQTSTPQTFLVMNSGQESASALTVSLPGTDFTVVTPPTGTDCVSSPASNATTLAPNASCTVRVAFTAANPTGTKSATLSVTATTGGTKTLALQGTAVAPSALSFSPPSGLNFGSVLQGGTGTATLTISNTGGVSTGALSTSSVGAEFALGTDGCKGVALGAGLSCSIAVTFKPTSGSGTASGTVGVTGSPGGTVSPSVSGTRASLTIAPASPPSFGSVTTGAVSTKQSFTISSPTATAGGATALSVKVAGTNPGDFSIDSNSCGATLTAGAPCTVAVTFRPGTGSLGARAATLTATANPGGSASVALGGTGVCRAGFADCDGNAANGCEVNVNTDPNNCGACGTSCPVSCNGAGACLKAVAIAQGGFTSTNCAVLSDGTVRCWGSNNFGQTGNPNTTGPVLTPFPVPNVTHATSVVADLLHSCAIVAGGAIECWGQAGDGLGISPQCASSPCAAMAVPNITGALAVTAGTDGRDGDFSCALVSGGLVFCWGDGSMGQLAIGISANFITPIRSDVTQASMLAPLATGACALMTGGTVSCWGANFSGQAGDGMTGNTLLDPAPVPGLTGVKAVYGGDATVCAALTSGGLECWGDNESLESGTGSADPQVLTPTAVLGLSGLTVTSVVGGFGHECALISDGTVRCWGANGSGQLGNGVVATTVATPVKVSGLTNAVQLTAGTEYTCALLSTGAVECWGDNSMGELGIGVTSLNPQPTPTLVKW